MSGGVSQRLYGPRGWTILGLCSLVVFVVNGVRPDIPVRDIFKGIWPFIFADIITLGVLTAFPEIVTFIVESND